MSESSEDELGENFGEHGENSGDFDGNFESIMDQKEAGRTNWPIKVYGWNRDQYAPQKTNSPFSDSTTYSYCPADRQYTLFSLH